MAKGTHTRVIPKTSDRGVTTIPMEAFDEVIEIVQNDFDGRLMIHDHEAGAYHGRPNVDVPHYLLELELEDDALFFVQLVIDPLIKAIIDEHTEAPVPIAS